MNVDPDQIIVGAGTEYLYGLLVKLLGTDKVYCVRIRAIRKSARYTSATMQNVCRCRWMSRESAWSL